MADDSGARYTRAEQGTIIVSCMLGFASDLYDVLIMPYLMPSIQRDLHITLGEVASITTVALAGSVVGGGLFGVLGDRIGRKKALQWTLILFSLASVASAFSPSFPVLLMLRFVVGIGLGGEWGAGMVLFNEAWNPARRGFGTALIQGSATLAAASASVVGLWAVHTFGNNCGWRVGLLTGGAPLLLAIAIRWYMPESKTWQNYVRHRTTPVREAPLQNAFATVAALFAPGLRMTTLCGTVWMTGYMFCYYGIVVFIPSLMLREFTAPPDVVRAATVTAAVIGGVSYIAMGWLNDRYGRRSGAIAPAMFWIVALGLLIFSPTTRYDGSYLRWPIFWLPITFAVGSSAIGVVGVWLSELYPIAVRATAVSSIYMVGRAAGSTAPLLVPLAASTGALGLQHGMLITLPAALAFLVISFLLPETRQKRRAGQDASDADTNTSASEGIPAALRGKGRPL